MIAVGKYICVFGGAVWSKEQYWKDHKIDLHVYDTGEKFLRNS